jgi:CubicO group peptidase (beta-lactamase class C family)
MGKFTAILILCAAGTLSGATALAAGLPRGDPKDHDMSLGEFLEERISIPLRMPDTGFSVRDELEVRWGGWAGTQFWIDLAEQLICIWMIQDFPNSGRYRWLFKNLVYQAIIE